MDMTMNRNTFFKLLSNRNLRECLAKRRELKNEQRDLLTARETLLRVNVEQPAFDAVNKKIRGYAAWIKGEENMIEDLFGVSWHWWDKLETYAEKGVSSVEQLPESITP